MMGYSDSLSFIDLTEYLLKLMYDESLENDSLKAIRAGEMYCFKSLYIVPTDHLQIISSRESNNSFTSNSVNDRFNYTEFVTVRKEQRQTKTALVFFYVLFEVCFTVCVWVPLFVCLFEDEITKE